MKKISIVILIILIITIFTSCSFNKNSAVKNLELDKTADDDKALAYIVNSPTKRLLEKITNVEIYESQNSYENFLFIPTYKESNISIYELILQDDELSEGKILFKTDMVTDDYALYIKTIRPEGIPFLKIVIEYNDSKGEYIVSYNGKEGTPKVEVINESLHNL